MLLFCMLLQNEMKDAHDALHACKKQAALVQDSLNVRTAILRGVGVALGLFCGDRTICNGWTTHVHRRSEAHVCGSLRVGCGQLCG
jgi:hypothetical protein